MKRVTLTVVTVLLAVPALAHAKAGIEFDNAIEQQKPGDRQTFSAMVMNEPSDPMGGDPEPVTGVRPLVTFRNAETGRVIRVRASVTNRNGIAWGSVSFPDRGPWSATLSVAGHRFAEPDGGQTFALGPPPTTVADVTEPPARRAPDGGGFPAWLISFPVAALAAFGIWRFRRRPRELGT